MDNGNKKNNLGKNDNILTLTQITYNNIANDDVNNQLIFLCMNGVRYIPKKKNDACITSPLQSPRKNEIINMNININININNVRFLFFKYNLQINGAIM